MLNNKQKMQMIRLICINLLYTFVTVGLFAQKMQVESFSVAPFDISASKFVRKDGNGIDGGLIKVLLPMNDVKFEGNIILPIEKKTSEYWVYMTEGSKELRISIPGFAPILVDFRKCGVAGIVPKITYELVISKDGKQLEGVSESLSMQETKDNIEANKKTEKYNNPAVQNSPLTQYAIGYKYYNGDGVEENDIEAFKWFQKAAKQGFAKAQYYLGIIYTDGITVERNDVEAAKWYRKAAGQGHAMSQFEIGCMHKVGKGGCEQNDVEAFRWVEKAAVQGYDFAQVELGQMYESGRGVEKNINEAVKWYRKAANQGNCEALSILGLMYYKGHGSIEKNEEEAFKWYRQLALEGEEIAQSALGDMYYDGRGVEKNFEEAVRWYRKAAAQGYDEAKQKLLSIASLKPSNFPLSPNELFEVEKEPIRREIYFDAGEWTIRNRYAQEIGKIEDVVNYLKKYPQAKVSIAGYDAAIDGNVNNETIAEKRAQIVKNKLEELGIAGNRIACDGYGSKVQPFANDERNRAVIIIAE